MEKKRITHTMFEIVELVKVGVSSRKELSHATGKSIDNIRHIVSKMIELGFLRDLGNWEYEVIEGIEYDQHRWITEPNPKDDLFWMKVDKTNDCWVWTGRKTNHGYGTFSRHPTILAHRYSWSYYNGEIPKGLCVLHKCDNPPCVNPDHLSIGTQSDNQADKMSKQRQSKGEVNGSAKLTGEQVLEIRRLYELGYKQVELANKYGVQYTTIKAIAVRRTWKHI